MHIDIAKFRLKNRFHVEVDLSIPKVSYRETVLKSARAQYRHKKQTGGAGQFARAATLPLGAVAPERFSPPRRWDSMPAEEEGWMREARLAAMVQSGRRGGRSGRGSRRRPRRSAEERERGARPEDTS